MNTQGTSGRKVTIALPLYELIDKDGNSIAKDRSPAFLGHIAHDLWPGEGQDEDRSGRGWDIGIA